MHDYQVAESGKLGKYFWRVVYDTDLGSMLNPLTEQDWAGHIWINPHIRTDYLFGNDKKAEPVWYHHCEEQYGVLDEDGYSNFGDDATDAGEGFSLYEMIEKWEKDTGGVAIVLGAGGGYGELFDIDYEGDRPLGVYYCDAATVENEWGKYPEKKNPDPRKRAADYMRGVCKEYNLWAEGYVFGWQVADDEEFESVLDSVWGYITENPMEVAQEAISHIKWLRKEEARKRKEAKAAAAAEAKHAALIEEPATLCP